ncbi:MULTISPECIES: hypothetical protein [unclassified Streptomyces]|uniref:hypothetical protein n=1 Tax=unclassified Streptomyces TaxID=2593676 RepID=UPI002E2B7CAA|nr:hypothetical protein [Streptomyces sp. NBC_00273]
MNSLKGLGVCAVLGALAFALTKVEDMDQLILGASIGIVTLTLIGYMASIRRSRRDRRIARGSSTRG